MPACHTTEVRRSMLQDAVVAIVPAGLLGDLLPAIHRAGMGYLARVATPARGPLLGQLQRAGIPSSQAPDVVAASEQIIFLQAGGRSMMTASLFLKHGITQVWIVNTLGAWVPVDDQVIAAQPLPRETPATAQHVPGRGTETPIPPDPGPVAAEPETGPVY